MLRKIRRLKDFVVANLGSLVVGSLLLGFVGWGIGETFNALIGETFNALISNVDIVIRHCAEVAGRPVPAEHKILAGTLSWLMPVLFAMPFYLLTYYHHEVQLTLKRLSAHSLARAEFITSYLQSYRGIDKTFDLANEATVTKLQDDLEAAQSFLGFKDHTPPHLWLSGENFFCMLLMQLAEVSKRKHSSKSFRIYRILVWETDWFTSDAGIAVLRFFWLSRYQLGFEVVTYLLTPELFYSGVAALAERDGEKAQNYKNFWVCDRKDVANEVVLKVVYGEERPGQSELAHEATGEDARLYWSLLETLKALSVEFKKNPGEGSVHVWNDEVFRERINKYLSQL